MTTTTDTDSSSTPLVGSNGGSSVFSRLRPPNARSHTHRPVDEIYRELNIGSFERLMLWLSKTDPYVLWLSTYHTRMTLMGLGMMVLFTSTLAAFSGWYALYATLVDPESGFRMPITITLALIYAFGIMLIDREIVGSVSNKALWVRVVFAVLIATAISWPVKLKFFEGRVKTEVNRMIAEKNVDKLNRVAGLKQTGEPERKQQRAAIQGGLNSLDREIKSLDDQIDREGKIVECGPKCQNFRNQKEALMVKRKSAEGELAKLAAPGALPTGMAEEVRKLESEIAAELAISYDFLTKWEALDRIKNAPGSDYKTLSVFLMLFFLSLELVPLALKATLGKTEYHYYIESRTNLNNQKIISLTNLFMDAMQQDPGAVGELIPLEITDIIAAHMEDEARHSSDQIDYRGLAERLRGRPAAATTNPSNAMRGSAGGDNTRRTPPSGDPIIGQAASDETINEPPPV